MSLKLKLEDIFPAADDVERDRRKAEFNKNLPKSYADWGRREGLSNSTAEAFGKYMTARWGDVHLNDGYGEEWLQRFKNGTAWDRADNLGRSVLRKIGYHDG